ncbi:MAG TPA: rhomboid family intramembrane serine protease [Cyclobacteriaceae bacterium]|jgi:rhomboid-like protein|nr:rhomboid family intramembrane serine protease [Cyclobacteriaceae bacterium]
MFRVTPVVRNLIIINVVVFIGQMLPMIAINAGCLGKVGLSDLFSIWPVNTCAFKPYQFFTYMFAHGGVMHIAFNMLALASYGPILESYWGEKKFLLFYIITGLGASIFYALVNYYLYRAGAPMLGASGAIYGLLVAFGLIFPNMEVMLMFVPIPIKAKYMVFIIGILTYMTDNGHAVAHTAHLGGALMGFIMVRLIWNDRSGSY